MKSEMKNIAEAIISVKNFFTELPNIAAGLVGTIIGYFIPIKDVVHLLIIFFFLDVVFGYLVDRKENNARFKVAIVWNHTFPRMLISIILIMATYMWDNVYKQEVVSTYNLVGWFICGVLIFSIAENAFILTRWSVFLKIRNMIRKNISDKTGEDLSEKFDYKKESKSIMKNKENYK